MATDFIQMLQPSLECIYTVHITRYLITDGFNQSLEPKRDQLQGSLRFT
jgi:hypothetical protein